MKNKEKTENTVISNNSFSAIEKVVEVQLLKFATGKELWIHSDEAQKLRNYLNSLDLKQKLWDALNYKQKQNQLPNAG